MKIYIDVEEKTNHFAYALGDALTKLGCIVAYGSRLLWENEVLEYDVVHFQWPEGVFGHFKHKVTDEELKRVEERLVFLKRNNKKIFATVHNLEPHTNKDPNVIKLYDIIYCQAHVIIHMGNFSKDLLSKKYPKATHVIIPHHIYDDIYNFSYDKNEARAKLGLPIDKDIILCFGKFRNDRERNFLLDIRRRIDSAVYFVTPGFYRESLRSKNPIKLIKRIVKTLQYKSKDIKFSNEVIPDDDMQRYFCAADVVLIQRPVILNSGNLPMAYAAGKVVVGPDVGNVGGILRDTNNFVFNPDKIDTAVMAIHNALVAAKEGLGSKNKDYAYKEWSSSVIARRLLEFYSN